MSRRRIATMLASVLAALGATALLVAPGAEARQAGDAPVTALASDGEWACVALGSVDLGICLDNPLPDVSQYDNAVELVLGLLGLG